MIEVGGIGPNPFAAMMLADMGADVVRLERPGGAAPMESDGPDPVSRGRPALEVDLSSTEGRALAFRLAESADALIEGFRPGVMERLGLGPADLMARNPGLVYGRITGYGQDGPLSAVAGHDINYIAIAGALGTMARSGERPMFPLNLVGDYGGGAVMLAFGVVCALLEARRSGEGQVVDASMVDGAALLMSAFHGFLNQGLWTEQPGTNFLDSGSHFYDVYETADGGHMAVGAVEPQFYAELLRLLEIDPGEAPQWERERWPELKQRFAAVFKTRTRDEWTERFESAEACTTPVLSMAEARTHYHNVARETFTEGEGGPQPRPAPRFSRTPPVTRSAPPIDEALAAWGLSAAEIEALLGERSSSSKDREILRGMSEENVEIARKAMEAFNRRDRDAWLATQDPEAEFRADPEWPESETVRGREAVWDFIVSLVDAWEQSDFEMVEIIDSGDDTLVARYRRPVQGKASGIADVLDYWSVATFRRGRILNQEWFAHRAEALRAAGLSE